MQNPHIWALALEASSACCRVAPRSSVHAWSCHPLFERKLLGEIERFHVQQRRITLPVSHPNIVAVDNTLRLLFVASTINKLRSFRKDWVVALHLDSLIQQYQIGNEVGPEAGLNVRQLCVDTVGATLFVLTGEGVIIYDARTGTKRSHMNTCGHWDMVWLPEPHCRLVVTSAFGNLAFADRHGYILSCTTVLATMTEVHCMSWNACSSQLVMACGGELICCAPDGTVIRSYRTRYMANPMYMASDPATCTHYLRSTNKIWRVRPSTDETSAMHDQLQLRDAWRDSNLVVWQSRRRRWLLACSITQELVMWPLS